MPTKTQKLTYTKQRNASREIEYMAQTPTHRYLVRRDDRPGRKSEWLAEVWTVKTAGFIDPLVVGDRLVLVINYCGSRAEAYELVQEHAENQKS